MTLKTNDLEQLSEFELYKERKYTNNQFNDTCQNLAVNEYNKVILGYNKEESHSFQGGDSLMDSKEYVDLRIDALEKNINLKFEAQQNLFVGKMDNIESKIDSKIEALQATILTEIQKSNQSISDKIASTNTEIAVINNDLKHFTTELPIKINEELRKNNLENKKELKNNIAVTAAVASVIASITIAFVQHFIN